MRKHWCEVRGCSVPGQVEVKFTDPDGTNSWWSCWRHAKWYYEWFRLQTEKEQAEGTATSQDSDGNTVYIVGEGSTP